MKVPKVAFYTLGCKVNQYETETMIKEFLSRGFELVDFSEEADVYVINTCTVTSTSDRKCRKKIRQAVRRNPSGFVVVTGCYVDRNPIEIWEIPGVDLAVPNREKTRLAQLIVEKLSISGVESGEPQRLHTRALVKIQDGCNQFCSYCIVPYVRGTISSRQEEEILNEVEGLIQSGVKEVVVTGIRLGKYGVDLPTETNLVKLLAALARMPLARIRLSSLEVKEITPELIALMASSPKFCRHLHIPLQSGDNEILRSMNRDYKREEYLQIIREIRENIPEIAITTDVMVGFPGEGEEQFHRTRDLMMEVRFRKTHVFKFSPREETVAASLPNQIPPEVKEKRSAELLDLNRVLAAEFVKEFVGRDLEVLVERIHNGVLTGLTDNYIRVYFEGPAELKGKLMTVHTLQAENGCLYGKLLYQRVGSKYRI
ncbi:MAG: tRNA (N(6)-L-threonylcarbamoyladenosine(37)-C(2))-methylthiotransferase MtaB [Actinomycetota bacterium]|nr:tRNA (N(6)-L-threonylcarbamoyladenosine(37)-C(2))-methylthiotransferase MtaB [Actinomycetota bacterium]